MKNGADVWSLLDFRPSHGPCWSPIRKKAPYLSAADKGLLIVRAMRPIFQALITVQISLCKLAKRLVQNVDQCASRTTLDSIFDKGIIIGNDANSTASSRADSSILK